MRDNIARLREANRKQSQRIEQLMRKVDQQQYIIDKLRSEIGTANEQHAQFMHALNQEKAITWIRIFDGQIRAIGLAAQAADWQSAAELTESLAVSMGAGPIFLRELRGSPERYFEALDRIRYTLNNPYNKEAYSVVASRLKADAMKVSEHAAATK